MIYLHIIKEDWNHNLHDYIKDGYIYSAFQLNIESEDIREKIYKDSLERTVNIIMKEAITETRHWEYFPDVILEYSRGNIKIIKDRRG